MNATHDLPTCEPFFARVLPLLPLAPRACRSAVLLVVPLVALLLSAGAARAQEVAWRTDYGKALKEAAEGGRPLLVTVGTENCYWCKQLALRTFSDAELAKLLNDRYIPLKIDANRSPYLAQALRVQSYPTLVFAGPDGTILGYKEGFIEITPLRQELVKVLTAVGAPDWMVRDWELACRAAAGGDSARAMALLRGVVEDGKTRRVQVKARKLLQDLEKQAGDRAAQAKDLAGKGKTAEAIAAIHELTRSYPGTLASREGKQLLRKLTSKAETGTAEHKRQAEELLRQAREDYQSQQLLCCLDRCEILASQYADLPEGTAAEKMASEIKENPEWTRQACDQLGERLCVLYLALADSWLRKGDPQQALFYLERVSKLFPGSRYAEMAQVRLSRLRGSPASGGEAQKEPR